MDGPDPAAARPVAALPQVGFLKGLVKNPNIVVGDYTYYDDPEGPERFEQNVLYLSPLLNDRLVIGRFCAIGRGVRFVMNGANHRVAGLSTYPFEIFGLGWEGVAPKPDELPLKGDTFVGNDVWLGYDALIMPGVSIGDGAIVGSRAVVTRDVAPYTVVGGNPAKAIKRRFPDATIEKLLAIKWWDWDAAKITRNLKLLVEGDVEALEKAT